MKKLNVLHKDTGESRQKLRAHSKNVRNPDIQLAPITNLDINEKFLKAKIQKNSHSSQLIEVQHMQS